MATLIASLLTPLAVVPALSPVYLATHGAAYEEYGSWRTPGLHGTPPAVTPAPTWGAVTAPPPARPPAAPAPAADATPEPVAVPPAAPWDVPPAAVPTSPPAPDAPPAVGPPVDSPPAACTCPEGEDRCSIVGTSAIMSAQIVPNT